MKFDEIAGSKNDEYYTPVYAIEPLLKYIQPHSTIWCPFDLNESLYVKTFRDSGHEVINTHIEYGQDFFDISGEDCGLRIADCGLRIAIIL